MFAQTTTRRPGHPEAARAAPLELVIAVALLVAVGVVMAFSTTMADSPTFWGNTHFLKQLAWVFLSLAALGMASFVPVAWYRRAAWPLLLLTLGTLGALLVPGVGSTVHGATRWLRFHGVGFQPSELAKFSLVVWLAWWLSAKEGRPRRLAEGYLPALLVTGVLAVLILVEPDFGTACLIGAIGLVAMFVAGVRLLYLVPTVLAALPVLWYLVTHWEYRMRRLLAFLDPWQYPDTYGFHVIQSLIALGSGGLYGLGVGGSQQKLYFLPEADADFIFSIIGEELGYLGALLVIGLFVLLIWQVFRVAHRARDGFGFLAACGVGLWLGMQALIHIGVVAKALPTKGIPLPFISCGGSSLFFCMLAVGMVVSIAREDGSGGSG